MYKKILFLFIILMAGISRASAENDSLKIDLLQPKFELNSPVIDVLSLGADWKAQRIARLDEQIIAAIAEGRRREVRREVEPKISALLAGLCSGEPEKADLQRLSGAVLAVRLRRAYHSFPLRTERDELRDSPLAQNDLALGRHLARYAETLAAEDNAAQVAVLQELLSGLLVLSADQVENFAERLGEVLGAHTRSLAEGCTETRRQAALSVAINPALLVFDLAKYRGFNATHRWLETQAMQLRGIQLQPARLYTFDPVAGVLIGFDEPALILDHLDELIDPENIAFGHCSVGQMASAGAETGRFACTLGPQCKPGGGSDKRGKGGIFGFDLSRLFGGGQQAEEDDRPEQSPFGLPTRGLGDNCVAGGAGGTSGGQAGSGSGGGGAPFSRGGGGFAQCMANAAFENAMANDPARCMLAAQQRLRDARNNEIIIVGQGEGGPVIKGIYGNDSCTTNPRMVGADQYNRTGGAKSSTDTMRDAIKDIADELRQEGSEAQEFIQNIANTEMSQQDFEDLADNLENDSRVCQGCLDDNYGETDPGDRYDPQDKAEYTFDADKHESNPGECNQECYEEMLDTALHEAGHGANRRNTYDDHPKMKGYGKGKESEEKAKEIIEEINNDNNSMPLPGEPYQPCGPVADAFREMMACTSGQVAGMDGGGNPIPHPDGSQPDEGNLGGSRGNTDGNVDPTEEQWINDQYGDNAFSRCMASEGMTVVGDDGRVYQIGGDKQSRESCSTITCRPPAEPTVVNDMCRCVVEGQRERIGAIIAQHERTRHCGRMMVDCSRTPNSPCCKGGAPGIKPDLGPRGPGGDPEIFKPDTHRFNFDDKPELDRDGEPPHSGDDPEL